MLARRARSASREATVPGAGPPPGFLRLAAKPSAAHLESHGHSPTLLIPFRANKRLRERGRRGRASGFARAQAIRKREEFSEVRRSRTERQEGSSASLLEVYGGEGGIRTPGPGLSPDNCLAGSPVRPLQHLSALRWHRDYRGGRAASQRRGPGRVRLGLAAAGRSAPGQWKTRTKRTKSKTMSSTR